MDEHVIPKRLMEMKKSRRRHRGPDHAYDG
jgi:hypothetical protein